MNKFCALIRKHLARPASLNGIDNFWFRFLQGEWPRLDKSSEVQNIKPIRLLKHITIRLRRRQLKRGRSYLRVLQLRIGRGQSKFTGRLHWQLELRSDLTEISAFRK